MGLSAAILPPWGPPESSCESALLHGPEQQAWGAVVLADTCGQCGSQASGCLQGPQGLDTTLGSSGHQAALAVTGDGGGVGI